MYRFRFERFCTHLFRSIGEHEGTIAVSALLLTVVALFVQECSSNAMLSRQVGVITESSVALHKDMETLTDRMYDLDGSIHVLDRGLITIQTSATIHMNNFKEATESFSENIDVSIQGQQELITQIDNLNRNVNDLNAEMSRQTNYLKSLQYAAREMQASATALQKSAAFVERVTEKIAENTIPQYLELRFANEYYLSHGVDSYSIPITDTLCVGRQDSLRDSLSYDCIRSYLTYDVVNRQRWLPFFASAPVASGKIPLLQVFKEFAVAAYPSTDKVIRKATGSGSTQLPDRFDTLKLTLSANQIDYPSKEIYIQFPLFLYNHVVDQQQTRATGRIAEGERDTQENKLYYKVALSSIPDIKIVFKNIHSVAPLNSADKIELSKFVDSIAVDVGGRPNYYLTVYKIPYYFQPKSCQIDPDVDDRGALSFIPDTKENRKVLSDLICCYRRQIGKNDIVRDASSGRYYFKDRLRTFEQQEVINLFFRKLPREPF